MKYLIYSNSILQFLMMIFAPYQILAIQKNTANLPLVLGVGMVAGGLSSIYIGKSSDENRKGTFLVGMFLLIFVVLNYAFIDSLMGIIILQALYGVAYASYHISEKALIADLAVERGKEIGRYTAVLYMVSGAALAVSSLFVLPIRWLFPAIALCLLIPNVIIFKYLK